MHKKAGWSCFIYARILELLISPHSILPHGDTPRNFESAWSRASPSYGWWFCHTSSIMQWNTHLVRSELCQRSPDAPGRNSILLYVQDLLHHLHYGFSYCFPSDFALLNKCRVFWLFSGCLQWIGRDVCAHEFAGASVFLFLFKIVYECLCIVFFMSPDFFEIFECTLWNPHC